MTRRSAAVLRPLSLRDLPSPGARLLALGIGAALVAGPAMAQDASATEEASVELDTLNVEDRAADQHRRETAIHPNSQQAEVLGFRRADEAFQDDRALRTVAEHEELA